jgi:peptidyl-prolyl cis-trans isomerase D
VPGVLLLIRNKKNSPLLAGLLFLVIFAMIAIFGPGIYNCLGGHLYAARVNGETIGIDEFGKRYAQAYRNMQQQNQSFDHDAAKRMNLREKVLNNMINTKLLAGEARRIGLAVDNQALRDSIVANPNFQTDGHFDKSLYERVINYYQMTPSDYEQTMREELLAQKLAALVDNGVAVSSNEAKAAWENEESKMNLEFIRLRSAAYEGKTVAPTDADVEAFTKGPGADDEIQKYYTKYARTKYNIPKKVHARQIAISVPKDAPPDLKKDAQKKITKAREEHGPVRQRRGHPADR